MTVESGEPAPPLYPDDITELVFLLHNGKFLNLDYALSILDFLQIPEIVSSAVLLQSNAY